MVKKLIWKELFYVLGWNQKANHCRKIGTEFEQNVPYLYDSEQPLVMKQKITIGRTHSKDYSALNLQTLHGI